MHTITLKTDNNMFNILNDMVETLGVSRSEVIRKAVLNYKEILESEKLKKQLIKASIKVREHSIGVSKEFENSIDDGLDNV
jgi:metal-responsive CopG/Arc/MetJ family transcriptional regulator